MKIREIVKIREIMSRDPTETLYVMSRIAPESVYRSLNRRIENMQDQAQRDSKGAA